MYVFHLSRVYQLPTTSTRLYRLPATFGLAFHYKYKYKLQRVQASASWSWKLELEDDLHFKKAFYILIFKSRHPTNAFVIYSLVSKRRQPGSLIIYTGT